jgi:S-DNA-T family DNA segregation ATPase FtsK/SpoIIIE
LPALLPVIAGRNVVLKASGAAKEAAVQALQSLMLRLLATVPPGKLRFLLIDPQFGQSVAGFVRDLPEELTGGKAWFEAQHIEQQLAALSEHMGMVIQKYLGNQYPTIEDYNAAAGEVAEPYRILVVIDFPANFTPEAARRLVNIAASGPRCGVYTLVSVDTAQPLPYGFNLADLERTATVIAWDGKRFAWQDPDFKDCLLEPDAPPPSDLFDRILSGVGAAAKEAMKVEVPFEKIAPPPPFWWQGKAWDGLVVPLGQAGARRTLHLELGRGTIQHALVAGRTQSGKSNLMRVLITT